jgi:hypothetical protein
MHRCLLVSCLIFALQPPVVAGAEVYLVQGYALGQSIPVPGSVWGEVIVWSTDGFFYNSSLSEARIRLLGVSNGALDPSAPTEFAIPSRNSTSLTRANLDSAWRPRNNDPLWVLRLDVPDGVVVDDALFVRGWSQLAPNPTFNPIDFKYGKIRLPVFSALTPPNQPQINLVTSLGDPAFMPSHSNVSIYNGGATVANATIEVRRNCDDAVVSSTTVMLPANTIVQFANLPAAGSCAEYSRVVPPSSVYTVVTVDQPSFSFVSTLANNSNPLTSMSVTGPR